MDSQSPNPPTPTNDIMNRIELVQSSIEFEPLETLPNGGRVTGYESSGENVLLHGDKDKNLGFVGNPPSVLQNAPNDCPDEQRDDLVDGNESRSRMLLAQAEIAESRFKLHGSVDLIDEAINCRTQALSLTSEGHASRAHRLGTLGVSLWRRFERLGERTDVDKAIEYQSQAAQLTPDGELDKPTWLSSLGTSWKSRFQRLGEPTDVDKAIAYQTQAVQLADLEKAIEYQTKAVELTPDGHAAKPTWFSGLGNSWQSRYERLGELTNLDTAIECKTQAVRLTPNGHPNKPAQLSNLGISFLYRFWRLGELADVGKAIQYQTEAVLLAPDGHADKPGSLNNLGTSWRSRFERLGELADVDKAIQYQMQAVKLTPDGHASKPTLLSNLGTSWRRRFEHLSQISDLESARSSFQHAAELIVTDPETQIRSARQWANCSALLELSPLPAYHRSIALIPHLVWLGTTIQQRYAFLAKISDLAAEAAASAISSQAYDLALEWLEEGRSVVWNQILQLRTPFDDLYIANPILAQDLKTTASQLESAGSRAATTESSAGPQPDLETHARHHRALAANWERLLAEARKLPGFDNFMRPRRAYELKLAATSGPVVLINTHSSRCDALIIFPQRDDVVHLPLRSFSPEKAIEAREHLFSLVSGRGDEARGFKRRNQESKPEDQFRPLVTLWSHVVGPVLNALACTLKHAPDELPHVTWCATGVLSFLPLHAAGLYNGSTLNAFDIVVSSYTPTLSALLSPTTPVLKPDVGILAVGQANTRGFSPLPKTVEELSVVQKHAKTTRFQRLDEGHATIDEVLKAMDECSWVHFACHATQNPSNPAHSAFHLHDGGLTLETITKRAFKNKGLAFLSACQTATGDDKLPDESTHLAAGILMAGYPSVIATMWSIWDDDGPEIAEQVYAQMLKDGQMDHKKSARALHKAVAKLREKVGLSSIARWVPFIHIGL